MAQIQKLEQFGYQSMVQTVAVKIVEEEIRKAAKKLCKGTIGKNYAIFNPKIYIKSALKEDIYGGEGLSSIGIKVDGVFIGSDTKYWKILTKRIIINWFDNIKYRFRKHDE